MTPSNVFIRLLFLLACLPALILTSCIEGKEEIWINPDASGSLVVHYDIPYRAMSQIGDPADFIRALELIDEGEDGITITDLDFTRNGSRLIIHLEATFKDARELLSMTERNKELLVRETGTDPKTIDLIAGSVNFAIEGLTPTFNRIVQPAEIFPPVVNRRPKMLGSSTFEYIIHLPARVKETNAHAVSKDGKTVSWAFVLSEHFESPMEMSFTTELPIPWWAWAILALLTFVLAWLVWRFLIRRFV